MRNSQGREDLFNIFRTRLVTYLQHKSVGRHIRNSLFSTTSAAHYKDKVFLDGEFLHATIKYAAQCITYITNKPKNMIHIKCALGFCDEFPGYIIPNEELDDGPNTPLFRFSVLYSESNIKEVFPKMLMEISVRYLHNYKIIF